MLKELLDRTTNRLHTGEVVCQVNETIQAPQGVVFGYRVDILSEGLSVTVEVVEEYRIYPGIRAPICQSQSGAGDLRDGTSICINGT